MIHACSCAGPIAAAPGRAAQAIAAYQRLLVFEPGNVAARQALSAIFETQGRLDDALALFRGSVGPETDGRLAQLLLKKGQPEAALAAIERIPPPQHITAALGLATAFAAQGDRPRARGGAERARADRTNRGWVPLQCKLVELLNPEDGPAAAARELRQAAAVGRRSRWSGPADSRPRFCRDPGGAVAGGQGIRAGGALALGRRCGAAAGGRSDARGATRGGDARAAEATLNNCWPARMPANRRCKHRRGAGKGRSQEVAGAGAGTIGADQSA